MTPWAAWSWHGTSLSRSSLPRRSGTHNGFHLSLCIRQRLCRRRHQIPPPYQPRPPLKSAPVTPRPRAGLPKGHDLLRFHKVRIITNHYLSEVTPDGVILITRNFQRETIPAGTVAISIGLSPIRDLYDSILGKVPELYVLGDARRVSNVMGAVWDAYEVARSI